MVVTSDEMKSEPVVRRGPRVGLSTSPGSCGFVCLGTRNRLAWFFKGLGLRDRRRLQLLVASPGQIFGGLLNALLTFDEKI